MHSYFQRQCYLGELATIPRAQIPRNHFSSLSTQSLKSLPFANAPREPVLQKHYPYYFEDPPKETSTFSCLDLGMSINFCLDYKCRKGLFLSFKYHYRITSFMKVCLFALLSANLLSYILPKYLAHSSSLCQPTICMSRIRKLLKTRSCQ